MGVLCGSLFWMLTTIILDVNYNDVANDGVWLDAFEWRWVFRYPDGITWWGELEWAWAHGPWIIYWAGFSPAY